MTMLTPSGPEQPVLSESAQLLDVACHWRCQGKQVALDTVIQTWGSSPRSVGSMLLVDHSGHMRGFASGGCVEGALVEQALMIDTSSRISIAGEDWLLQVFNTPLQLIVIGAVHIAQLLAPMARSAGYAVTIVDPRHAFATHARFPGVTLVHQWPAKAMAVLRPTQRTAVVTLSHDAKLDQPALTAAVSCPAFYVGALGSRRIHNPYYRSALANSLNTGLRSLPQRVDGALICLGDIPKIKTALLAQVPVEDPGVLFDVDTPAALSHLLAEPEPLSEFAAPRPHFTEPTTTYWQHIAAPESLTAEQRSPPWCFGYPALLPRERYLLLPIRQLPDNANQAVASLICNQASLGVVEELGVLLAARLRMLDPDVIVGLPTLGLTLAAVVARHIGHARYVPMGYSRKFWYDEQLSVAVSSITTPQAGKRVYLDPNQLALVAGRRVALVDDAVSSGRTMAACWDLLQTLGADVVGCGVAMRQSDRWREHLGPKRSARLVGVFDSPLLQAVPDGWQPA